MVSGKSQSFSKRSFLSLVKIQKTKADMNFLKNYLKIFTQIFFYKYIKKNYRQKY